MNATMTIGTFRTIDLSGQYDCAASQTVLDFAIGSEWFRARRFCRADLASTGKVEIYRIAGDDASVFSEEFCGYANPAHTSDRAIIRAIEAREVSLPLALIELDVAA